MGGLLGVFGQCSGAALEGLWGVLGASREGPGVVLGGFRGVFGASWAGIGGPRVVLGVAGDSWVGSWESLGAVLGRSWAGFERSWAIYWGVQRCLGSSEECLEFDFRSTLKHSVFFFFAFFTFFLLDFVGVSPKLDHVKRASGITKQ